MIEYTPLFDISMVEFELNWRLIGGAIVFASIATFFGLQSSRRDRVGSLGLAAMAIAFMGVIQTSLWLQHRDLNERFRQGEYLVAEGCVSGFDPGSPGGNRSQTFYVSGRRFDVNASRVNGAFNRSIRAGGPDLRGKFVRIAYLDDGRIIWLGEARHDTCRS